jgi:putative peptidoglycan lipid II flippase
MNDTIESIRRTSHRFFSGTLLSRISGMFRDMSMAYVFGTEPAIAAFMVAFRFAHLLRRLFGEGALQTAFIPSFESLRHHSEARAFTFFRDLTLVLSTFLTILIALASGVLSAFLYWGNLQTGPREVVYLTLLMLPSLLFICLFGLNSAFLQCEKKYFIPSVAPVAFNAIQILCMILLKDLPAAQAMPWLSLGIIIACFFQWLITVPAAWKNMNGMFSFISVSWRSFFSPELMRLYKPLSLGILGVAASQINNAVDSVFALYAEAEGPAFLWYAIRIQQLPLALFGIAIAGAVLPPLSRALKGDQWERFHTFLHDALLRTWKFILPITAALFVMGETGVNLLYGHGDFSPQAAVQTTYCLWAYGAGLIPMAMVLVLAPACYAQNNYGFPALISVGTMFLNIFLNTLFIVVFHFGSISVALATSISAWANFCLMGGYLSWKGTAWLSRALLQQAIPTLLSSIAAFWGTYQVTLFLREISYFADLFAGSRSFIEQTSFLACQVLVFGIIYYLCNFFMDFGQKILYSSFLQTQSQETE